VIDEVEGVSFGRHIGRRCDEGGAIPLDEAEELLPIGQEHREATQLRGIAHVSRQREII